jgi:hypothetical protein
VGSQGDDAGVVPKVRVTEYGNSHVRIAYPEWPSSRWIYRLPEHIEPTSGRGNTTPGEAGEIRLEHVERGRDGSLTLRGVRPPPYPAEYRFVLRPGANVVNIRATIQNTGDEAWSPVARSILCLQFTKANRFMDRDLSQTLFRSNGEFIAVKDTDFVRETGDKSPHCAHLLRQDDLSRFSGDAAVHFADRELSDCSLIVRSSTDSQRHVAVAWENALHVSYNLNRELNCIHSNPRIGALEPGESIALRGKIYLFTGTREELYRRYLEDFPDRGL